MTLPANSTFLPVLDDLLSPDLRPILQTPTTEYGGVSQSTPSGGRNYGFANVMSTNEGPSTLMGRSHQMSSPTKKIHFKGKGHGSKTLPEEDRASRKIQHWWRSRSERRHSDFDIRAERAKHTIRHNRTEDHVLYLETEVSRLKSALSAERKARSLQMDAIRCLWSQVQQMSATNSESAMTQSMPNGLTSSPKRKVAQCDNQMSVSFAGPVEFQSESAAAATSCTANCSKEIQLLRESMSTEIAQLRDMLSNLRMDAPSSQEQQKDHMEVDSSLDGDNQDQETTPRGDNSALPQRPFSLNILGMTTSGSASSQADMETPEITEYAGLMARNLLEKAVESEDEASQHHARFPSKIPVKKLAYFEDT